MNAANPAKIPLTAAEEAFITRAANALVGATICMEDKSLTVGKSVINLEVVVEDGSRQSWRVTVERIESGARN